MDFVLITVSVLMVNLIWQDVNMSVYEGYVN